VGRRRNGSNESPRPRDRVQQGRPSSGSPRCGRVGARFRYRNSVSNAHGRRRVALGRGQKKRRELERSGIDIDAVRSDFVTHQTIYTYLTNVRDASLPDEDTEDRLERKKETVQRLAGRTQVVTESTLEELRNAEEITDREYDVFVDVRTICANCGTDYSVAELLDQGGCDCEAGKTS